MAQCNDCKQEVRTINGKVEAHAVTDGTRCSASGKWYFPPKGLHKDTEADRANATPLTEIGF